MFHYVYRIDRPSTGQWYIGIRSHKHWPTEDRYMGSGILVKQIPRKELVKTILVIVETREEARRVEAALVGPEQVADPLCMNLCRGGEKGAEGLIWSGEQRRKLSESLKGQKRATGKRTATSRARMSAAHRGKKRSAAHRKAIADGVREWHRRRKEQN